MLDERNANFFFYWERYLKLFNKFHLPLSLNKQEETFNNSCSNLEAFEADGFHHNFFFYLCSDLFEIKLVQDEGCGTEEILLILGS